MPIWKTSPARWTIFCGDDDLAFGSETDKMPPMKRNEDWGWGSLFGVIGGIVFVFVTCYLIVMADEAVRSALRSQM